MGRIYNNIIENPNQGHPILVGVSKDASLTSVTGSTNDISPNYVVTTTSIDSRTFVASRQSRPIKAQYVDGNGTRQDSKPTRRFNPKTHTWERNRFPGVGA